MFLININFFFTQKISKRAELSKVLGVVTVLVAIGIKEDVDGLYICIAYICIAKISLPMSNFKKNVNSNIKKYTTILSAFINPFVPSVPKWGQ